MGIVETFESCGEVDREAASVRKWMADGNPADTALNPIESAIVNGLVGTGKVLPEIATEAGRILRDRILYRIFRPWDFYPLTTWGDKLALLTHGEYEDDEELQSRIDAFLNPIRDDLILKGCPEAVASGWCEEIVGECCSRIFEFTHAGGHQMGRA